MRTPIVSVTPDALPSQVQEALAAGADRRLAKLIAAAALIGAMSSVMQQRVA
jgi:hypothetical protein